MSAKNTRDTARTHALQIYQAAIKAVQGRACVSRSLRQHATSQPVQVIAIGKAAAAMCLGAYDALGDWLQSALVITRHGYQDAELADRPGVTLLQAGHPLPDQHSLHAGQVLLDVIARCPKDHRLLFLISGGASALVEVLPETVKLQDLQRANEWLLASGLPIQEINAIRMALSRIKGGQLVAYVGDKPAQVMLISDVPGDDPAVIGSGLLYVSNDLPTVAGNSLPVWLSDLITRTTRIKPWPLAAVHQRRPILHQIIASSRQARQAAAVKAQQLGYPVFVEQALLTGDFSAAAQRVIERLVDGPAGCYIWGGEVTVVLPPTPGHGGRCQSLALAMAMGLAPRTRACILAAGTDGCDGPGYPVANSATMSAGEIAGALVDYQSRARIQQAGLSPEQCLLQADAGRCLLASGDLIQTGPTGTNVMDLVMAIKY